MVELKSIANTFATTEEEVNKLYAECLQQTKELWGEENAEPKALRKLVAKLQRKKLSGSQTMQVGILATSEAKDFTQLILMSLHKKVAEVGEQEAIKKGIIDKDGNYYYQSGFNKDKMIDETEENFSQDYFALDIANKKVFVLSNKNKKIKLESGKIYSIETRKNKNNETYTLIQKLEVPVLPLPYEQAYETLKTLPYIKDTELLSYLKSGEKIQAIVEAYVIDIYLGQKLGVVFQIPAKEETLMVWVDDTSVANNLILDEPARVIITGAKFNSEKNQFTANSLYAFADPKVLNSKQDDEVPEEIQIEKEVSSW